MESCEVWVVMLLLRLVSVCKARVEPGFVFRGKGFRSSSRVCVCVSLTASRVIAGRCTDAHSGARAEGGRLPRAPLPDAMGAQQPSLGGGHEGAGGGGVPHGYILEERRAQLLPLHAGGRQALLQRAGTTRSRSGCRISGFLIAPSSIPPALAEVCARQLACFFFLATLSCNDEMGRCANSVLSSGDGGTRTDIRLLVATPLEVLRKLCPWEDEKGEEHFSPMV